MHIRKSAGARFFSATVAAAMLAGIVVTPAITAVSFDAEALRPHSSFILSGNGTPIDADSDGSLNIIDTAIIKRALTTPAPEAQIYYAVDAECQSADPETTNAGFTGTAYINYINQRGGYINWTVNAPTAGNYAVTIRYANSSESSRQLKITLNDDSSAYWLQDFRNTGAWTAWEEVTLVLPLTAGKNTIKALANTNDGGPNVDYISLLPTDEPATECIIRIIPDGVTNLESLDRGICAVKTGSGMLVSWRALGTDSESSVYRLYRDGTLIYTSDAGMATCYNDADGSASSKYTVETVSGGNVVSKDTCNLISGSDHFDIALNKPSQMTMPDGSTCTYSPNDCTLGDVDGDGEYEIILKWDPSNAKDNSQTGYTGNVFVDCYKLDGTRLWRIDLGRNIRAGAHYTQLMCGDFDSDGKAELCCKTSDGTIDGQGVVIGNASADYRNQGGYILSGNEYFTLFDGETGKALDTVNYNPARGNVSDWGDNYGNRVDRFLGAVMYLDGVTPSPVTVRGYYTRMTACAYDVVDDKLVEKWFFDSNNSAAKDAYGNGNHNCMPADVDGDGYQELVLGSTCIDHDGTLLWCNKLGHGDAMHLSDFLPDRNGLELWYCHENPPYGSTLIDAATGSILFRYTAEKDTGRACAANIWAGSDGAEFWGSAGAGLYNGSGTVVSTASGVSVNFLIYWDGDLERELIDGNTINKYNGNGVTRLLTANGYTSCNGTKSTPSLTADLFGDWREELVLAASDGNSLRIFCTPSTTKYRIPTLMHDITYRSQVAGENISYNQPPHTGFYLGSDKPLPEWPEVRSANQ